MWMKKEKGMVLIYRHWRFYGYDTTRLARGSVIFIYLFTHDRNVSRADCIDRAKFDVDWPQPRSLAFAHIFFFYVAAASFSSYCLVTILIYYYNTWTCGRNQFSKTLNNMNTMTISSSQSNSGPISIFVPLEGALSCVTVLLPITIPTVF